MPLDAASPTNTRIVLNNPTSLADIARADMERVFAGGPHRPSANQWTAISDYLMTVERIADLPDITEADRILYLSAIPAGTGKTVAVAAITRAIASSSPHEGVGIMIAVNRVTEVEDMADALKAHKANLYIASGRRNSTKLLELCGHTKADEAQIVITTQSALKETLRRTPERDFEQARRYFYRGQRRRVILWDEQIAFNRPVTLDSDTAVSLAKAMGRQSRKAASELKRWCADVDELPQGLHTVPNFRQWDIDFGQLEDDADDDIASQARALSIISGEQAYVHTFNLRSSLVTHIPELPRTLLPAVVTDASAARGVHHAAYDQMAITMPILRLVEAEKTYRNLTIKRVHVTASRSAYRDQKGFKARELIEMIVRYIQRCAPHQVLVITYKNRMAMKDVAERTIEEAVKAALQATGENTDRVRFVPWGRHTSTNEFKTYHHMIFAGLNFLPKSAAYAASGAALGRSMKTEDAKDHPTSKDVWEMERGMLRDSTLQAILRGAARIGVDGDCEPQEVVIPASPQTGLTDDDYFSMFPGCKVEHDLTLRPLQPLTGNPKRLFEVIMTRQAKGETEVDGVSIYTHLGMSSAIYSKTKDHQTLLAWLTGHGWLPQNLKGNRKGFRRTPM